MKTFTYVAAIALLTAGTAFAQSSAPNASTINNSTPTPSARGPVESPGTSSTTQSGTINQSGSMNTERSGSMGSSSSMDQSSMDRSSSAAPKRSSNATSHHIAKNSRDDAREDQETRQLNLRQVAGGNGASMTPSSMSGSSSMGYSSGMGSSGVGNSFNSGSPQQAQGGSARCTPDNPSCGTARQNPAINSSPQHRTYGAQE